MAIYALVLGKGGSKLQLAKDQTGAHSGMRVQRGLFTGTASPVRSIATALENVLGRPVIDKTGLQGKFDWKLEWTPELAPDTQGAANPPDLSGPSLFTALQEQLGLKLESQRGPAPILVIDRVEKPSAN